MSRLWLVAANTYTRQVFKKGFIASLISVPILVMCTLILVYVAAEMGEDRRPLGYVDNAAVLARPLPAQWDEGDKPITMIPFATAGEAHQALLAGDIQGYYILAADYRQTGQAEVVSKKELSSTATSRFRSLLRYNLLAAEPEGTALRIVTGPSVTIRRPDGGREFADVSSLADVAPIFAILFMAMGFMMLIGLDPGQPMLAVVEEKENRTMEMMVTAISPGVLIAGKIAGTVVIAGTLVAGWVALIAATLVLAVRVLHVSWLQGVHLSPSAILFAASLYVPLYIMIAALMTAVGSTVVEEREARQSSFIFIVPLMLPFYILEPVLTHPDSALAVALSLFPFSAPTVLPLRLFIEPVPTWQIALSVALLLISAAGAIWLAGRVFRLGMLRYGQRLSWRAIAGIQGGER